VLTAGAGRVVTDVRGADMSGVGCPHVSRDGWSGENVFDDTALEVVRLVAALLGLLTALI